jgi:hypothetical protein
MDAFILIVCGFVVGYLMGKTVANWTSALAFREILQDLGVKDADIERLKNKMDEEDTDTAATELEQVEVKIEQHQGLLYAYRCDNDSFLGQGKTREELIEGIKKNLINVKLIISEENGAKLIQNA